MALRFECPIFTNELVLKTANEIEYNITNEKTKKDDTSKEESSSKIKKNEYEFFAIEELEEMLQEAIENEDYEKASRIRDEIKKRNHS